MRNGGIGLTVGGLVLTAALAGWLLNGPRGKPKPPLRTVPASDHAAVPQTVGAASCSGRACHGGLGPTNVRGNEYTTWITRDPHAKAFTALRSEASRRMLVNLGRAPTIAGAHPETEALCLNCHGRSAALDTTFSCESCHGPAKEWLRPHADHDAWDKLPAAAKIQHGMWPLVELADRARVCAECHVGAPGREVNHDLIAAGHPRLKFEFDTYLANLPRHWQTDKNRDFSAAWAIGQAASAEAALTLLAHRADPAKKLPWPEFAEYDCVACHHDLRPDRLRQRSGVPGSLPWADWYYAMPRLLGVKRLNASLDVLAREMSKPLPPREETMRVALVAAARLQTWLKEKPPRYSLAARMPQRVGNWDTAAQLTLGLMADYQTRPKRDPLVDRTFAELFGRLRLPPEGDRDFDADKMSELLQAAAEKLATENTENTEKSQRK